MLADLNCGHKYRLLLPGEKLCCQVCTRSWSRRRRCRRTSTCRCCPSWSRWRSAGSPPRPPSAGTSWLSSGPRLCSAMSGIMKESSVKTWQQFADHWCMFVFSLIFCHCRLHSAAHIDSAVVWVPSGGQDVGHYFGTQLPHLHFYGPHTVPLPSYHSWALLSYCCIFLWFVILGTFQTQE